MKLYHGTSLRHLDSILADGIKPRGENEGNWAHTTESHPDAVYLTLAYPLYFSVQLFGNDGDDRIGTVIEIDTDRIDNTLLVPDEDALEIMTSRSDREAGDTRNSIERAAHYRSHLIDYAKHWKDSLNVLGNCAYMGTIPPEAITRYANIDWKKNINLLMSAADPTITAPNYKFCGASYRELVSWLFDDPLPQEIEDDVMRIFRDVKMPSDRDGIDVIVRPTMTPDP